ncbi:MAG: sulfotransferase family 2 domain-containing protein [Methylococcaceae bacterium]|nr:sulfotransferase family 2 domain-containing protein [Methylococcaceae bacterium]
MLISYSHGFIFFHVAKVAGLSLRAALGAYAEEPERFRFRRPPKYLGNSSNPLYRIWESQLLHAKAREARRELPVEVYDRAFKFAFVRNPWAWQVSMYHFILKETEHIHHQRVKAMSGFDEYLEWVIHTEKPFARGATKFQKDMLTDETDALIVDFVGRYERLEEDFERVCRRLSLKATLPHENRTTHRDYRSYYNPHTRHQVEEHFAPDIELFEYSFDGHHDSLPCPERR